MNLIQGLVENRCGEMDFPTNVSLALTTTLEKPGNVSVMPKVSRLRSVNKNLDIAGNTTKYIRQYLENYHLAHIYPNLISSTQLEAEVGHADEENLQCVLLSYRIRVTCGECAIAYLQNLFC